MRKEATKHTTESASSVGTQTRKKPYEKPRLAQFGKVTDLTLTGGSVTADGGRSLQG